jgi:hypothetical protein
MTGKKVLGVSACLAIPTAGISRRKNIRNGSFRKQLLNKSGSTLDIMTLR